ncbi:MAG TPA: hypothetical protein VIW69_13870 [Candidatus Elarobacter sp.]
MQSSGGVARIGELRSNLPAAYAFPVIVRGGRGGVVLLGNGDSLRSYAHAGGDDYGAAGVLVK